MPPTCTFDSDLVNTQSLDLTMAASSATLGHTMRLDDLGPGAVTPALCAASVPIPAELAKAIADELTILSGIVTGQDLSNRDTATLTQGDHEETLFHMAVQSSMDHMRAPDPRAQTLRITRFRKLLNTVSAAVAAAAMSEITRQISVNTVAIRQ